MRVKHFIQVVFLLAALSLGGVTTQAQGNRPHLRVINAALGIPSADVYVDGTLYFQGLYYGYVSNYIPVDQGSRSIRIRAAGVESGGDLVTGDANFEGSEGERRDYTVVILETSIWVFEDDNRSELRPGQTRVRAVNASQGPAVEICLDDQCETLTHQHLTPYITLDAGTYDFNMRLIGTDELYFDVLPITFDAGEVYSIFILDPTQGEVRPRIIPHADTGQAVPEVPGPGYPSCPGCAPVYPPVTGAFLSPVALTVIIALILILAGSFWIVRRYIQTS